MSQAEIKLEFSNLSFDEVERYKEIIHTLITSGALNIKNGKAILNFDHQGILQQITTDMVKYKRNKQT